MVSSHPVLRVTRSSVHVAGRWFISWFISMYIVYICLFANIARYIPALLLCTTTFVWPPIRHLMLYFSTVCLLDVHLILYFYYQSIAVDRLKVKLSISFAPVLQIENSTWCAGMHESYVELNLLSKTEAGISGTSNRWMIVWFMNCCAARGKYRDRVYRTRRTPSAVDIWPT